jgi:uncharacterized damage-inducible protein DinB
MSYSESILPEFDQEMASTRKVLERVPEDKLGWKAHPKSNSIGWNANHLADIPAWVDMAIKHTKLDIAPVGGESYKSPDLKTRQALLELFDSNVAAARKTLASVSDAEMRIPWTLLSGGQEILTMPRVEVIRSFVLNHTIHHRAILCVYLRLNDIPVPGMYGPSGDDDGSAT